MKKFLVVIAILFTFPGWSQNSYYSPPLKIPLVLSASFAELRSNHFHSGIDIKTQGKTGLPVFSVADGFISRISVSPSGFGNALYIDHYNGTTSVYGHLQEFREDIQNYIRKIQYQKKSFKIDVQVSPELFLVEKDDLIAKSGNTGSSGGPHLHFEIRDTKTEEPMNPLNFGFLVSDNTPPRFTALQITMFSDSSHVNYKTKKRKYDVVLNNGIYRIRNNSVIPVDRQIGIAIEANDYFDDSWNRCGISSMTMKMDGTVHFKIEITRFSFDQSRYINSYVDYAEWILNRRWYQKTWIEPGNHLKNYSSEINSGILIFNDEKIHSVEIEIADAHQNISVLSFSVKKSSKESIYSTNEYLEWFDFDKDNRFQTENFRIEIPEGALYTSLGFQHKTRRGPNDCFSEVQEISSKTIPLHKGATIGIKATSLEKRLQDKAYLAVIDDKTGNYWYAGGNYEDGWVNSVIRTFGDYAITIDTIPPTIVPLSISGKKTLTESNRIRFIIKDDLAGIRNYTGTIDGKWALFEYDAKNNLLSHYFDSERFELNKRHDFKLVVTDNKNNSAVYEASFWK